MNTPPGQQQQTVATMQQQTVATTMMKKKKPLLNRLKRAICNYPTWERACQALASIAFSLMYFAWVLCLVIAVLLEFLSVLFGMGGQMDEDEAADQRDEELQNTKAERDEEKRKREESDSRQIETHANSQIIIAQLGLVTTIVTNIRDRLTPQEAQQLEGVVEVANNSARSIQAASQGPQAMLKGQKDSQRSRKSPRGRKGHRPVKWANLYWERDGHNRTSPSSSSARRTKIQVQTDNSILDLDESDGADVQRALPHPRWLASCLFPFLLTRSSAFQASQDVHRLLDDRADLYWQSDGAPPHSVTIEFQRKTDISFGAMFLDFKTDESYTPYVQVRMFKPQSPFRIQVQTGNSILDLDEPMVLTS